MLKNLKTALVLAGVTAVSSTGVLAYEAGDMIVRAGLAYVSPDDRSTVTEPAALAGEDVVDVEDGISLGFSGTYMVSNQLGLELLLALPFTHDIEGYGVLNGVSVGETQHLPPTHSPFKFILN